MSSCSYSLRSCFNITLVWFLLMAYLNGSDSPLEQTRVAFIIAGSPRSFIYPAIHESIRVNLISSFCPMDSCSADVFVRVSLSDNTHETERGAVKDSRGIAVAGTEQDRPLIEHAISRLALNNQTHVHGVWVDVGSVAEQEDMKAKFTSLLHRIYRTLDPRRYSMSFGRWSAYQQAKNYEREHGLHYTWFVHTRFDMAFGAPIQPYSHWSSNKLWVHDMWTSYLPDVFALLPSRFADAYFSMELLVREGAMCLGGPNFNPQHATISRLNQLGFTYQEIGKVMSIRCPNPDRGFSEEILMRKLTSAGISFAHGNIGMATIFSVIIRKSFKAYCMSLRPDLMFLYVRSTQNSNAAVFPGCVGMTHHFRELHLHNESLKCTPLPLMSKEAYTGECMLNPQVSGYNYMPFRIRLPRRLGSYCLTVNELLVLTIRPCVAHEHVVFIPSKIYPVNASYSIAQLFRVYPNMKDAQPIIFNNYSKVGNLFYCLEGSTAEGKVTMRRCAEGVGDANQRMRIRLRGKASKAVKVRYPNANVKARIEFNGHCLAYMLVSPSTQPLPLSWQRCPLKRGAKDLDVGFVFELERTKI